MKKKNDQQADSAAGGTDKGKGAAFDLCAVSSARPHLLGLATLWIVLFHSWNLDLFQIPFLSRIHMLGLLNRLKETGNCGVDIFLFLSGLGLVYSWEKLSKSSSHPLRDFYRKRLRRIMPPVLLVSLIYYGLIGTENLADWMGKIFLYGHFSAVLDGGQYWYFALLLVLYLLFPLIHRLISRFSVRGLLGCILLSVGGTLLLRFAGSSDYFEKTEILWTRIPIFLLGVWFGHLSLRHVSVPGWIPIVCLPLAVLTWLAASSIPGGETMYLRRYAYAALTLFIVISHAWILSRAKGQNPLHRAVARIGTLSMEIYLTFEIIYLADPPLLQGADPAGVTYGITVFAVSLFLSALLQLGLSHLLRESFQL